MTIADRLWPNLLLANIYLLSIGLSGALFISMHFLSGATWSTVLRRVAEAMMAVLPVAAVLMLPIFWGRDTLYPLATAGFFLRAIVFLALWVWLARRLRHVSLDEDRDGTTSRRAQLVRYAAIFIVVFAITFAVAAADWLMSLAPQWSSSIFAVYVFAGVLVSGLAVLTLMTIVLRRRGPLGAATNAAHLHDLGKLLFTFTTFWAYIWLSQYLLIWYGNLPEEIPYYARRTRDAWFPLFLLNVAINWAIPFFLLLPRASKRSARMLAAVCVLLLAGHWLDLYLLIMPEIWSEPAAGPLEAAIPIGYAAIGFYVMTRAAGAAPIVPAHDPLLRESLVHET
jgi:hypothetical protein